jgi:hypothetical protein
MKVVDIDCAICCARSSEFALRRNVCPRKQLGDMPLCESCWRYYQRYNQHRPQHLIERSQHIRQAKRARQVLVHDNLCYYCGKDLALFKRYFRNKRGRPGLVCETCYRYFRKVGWQLSQKGCRRRHCPSDNHGGHAESLQGEQEERNEDECGPGTDDAAAHSIDAAYPTTLIYGSLWTATDKQLFFKAIESGYQGDMDVVSRLVETKTAIECELFCNALEQGRRSLMSAGHVLKPAEALTTSDKLLELEETQAVLENRREELEERKSQKLKRLTSGDDLEKRCVAVPFDVKNLIVKRTARDLSKL